MTYVRGIIFALAAMVGMEIPTTWATIPVRQGQYVCWTEHKVDLPNETLCAYAPYQG